MTQNQTVALIDEALKAPGAFVSRITITLKDNTYGVSLNYGQGSTYSANRPILLEAIEAALNAAKRDNP